MSYELLPESGSTVLKKLEMDMRAPYVKKEGLSHIGLNECCGDRVLRCQCPPQVFKDVGCSLLYQ